MLSLTLPVSPNPQPTHSCTQFPTSISRRPQHQCPLQGDRTVCTYNLNSKAALTSSVAGAVTSHGSSCSWAINARSFRIRTTSFMTACKFTVWPLVNIWSPRRLTGRYLRGTCGISEYLVWGKGRVLQPLTHAHYRPCIPHYTQDNQNSHRIQVTRTGKYSHHLQPGSRTATVSQCPSPFHPLPEIVVQLLNTPFSYKIKSIKGYYLEGGTTKKSRKNTVGLNLDSIPTSSSPEKRKFRKNPVFEISQKDHLNLCEVIDR